MPGRPSLALVGALVAALLAAVGVLTPPSPAAAAATSAATAMPAAGLPPRGDADNRLRPDALPGRRRRARDAAARRRGGRHGGRRLPRRERRARTLPGGAVRLRRALPQGLGADPATASLRSAGLTSRLLAVHRTGERRRLRGDARPRLRRGPPGPQLEPARAHGGHLLGDVPQPGGPGGGLGAPAGHLRDPRHAPGPVLALHRARQERDRPLGLHPVGGRRRSAGVGRAGRRQAGVRAVRHRRAEPGRIGVLLQLLAQLARRPAPRGRHRGPACRTTTSARSPRWRGDSRAPRPCSATS